MIDSVHNWFLYPVSHGGYFRMTDLDREKLKRVYACVFGVCVCIILCVSKAQYCHRNEN